MKWKLRRISDHGLGTNCNESLQLSFLTEIKKTSWKQVCKLILVVLFQSLIFVHETNICHTDEGFSYCSNVIYIILFIEESLKKELKIYKQRLNLWEKKNQHVLHKCPSHLNPLVNCCWIVKFAIYCFFNGSLFFTL